VGREGGGVLSYQPGENVGDGQEIDVIIELQYRRSGWISGPSQTYNYIIKQGFQLFCVRRRGIKADFHIYRRDSIYTPLLKIRKQVEC
jgi:hypothetical protein